MQNAIKFFVKKKFLFNRPTLEIFIKLHETQFLSPPVRMHGGLICITFFLSVCDLTIIDWTKNHWTKIQISKSIAHMVMKFGLGMDMDDP